MTAGAKRILHEALALSEGEREELVDALSRSLHRYKLTPEWEAEIAHRMERIESGEAVVHDAVAILEELKAKHGA